jgi:peptide/nickel transport system substrate-binding protein
MPTEQATPVVEETAVESDTPSGELKEIPRNRTLMLIWGGEEGRYIDHELWNPYAVGSNHQNGPGLFYEPLFFYSAFADEWYPWLAESYEYNDDFTELIVKLRPGIKWSDGEPFTAEDVAFTLNGLRDQGANLLWGTEVQRFVKETQVVDPFTVKVQLKVPAPRFLYFMTYKFDIGVYPVPKHIFEDYDDWTIFTHFDLEKDWPVTTSPWKVVYTSPEQKIIDRRDDWWAVDAGLASLPEVERIVYIPWVTEPGAIQAVITNQVDVLADIQPRMMEEVLAQSESVITHSGRELPYGYVDWWPIALYLNNQKPPFDNADVRWAISYYINRQQIIDVGYGGAGTVSQLPLPTYKPLLPHFQGIDDLLAEYDTTEYNPEKGDALLGANGYVKDKDGFWIDGNGQRIALPINGFGIFGNIGPVIAEQLLGHGIDALYQMPVDAGEQFYGGSYSGQILGQGGSIKDPYATLALFQSSTQVGPGGWQMNPTLWSNPEYDAIVDEVYVTPMEDTDKLKKLFREAMEIWLPELPNVQLTEWYHRIPMNTTYWQGWPTEEDPYVNGAFWHLTFPLILNRLKSTQ